MRGLRGSREGRKIAEDFKEDGSLKPLHEIPAYMRRAVSGVEVAELSGPDGKALGTIKRLRFWDKPRALEMLGRHLRLFTDKVEHTGANGGPIVTEGHLTDEDDLALSTFLAGIRAGLVPPGSSEPYGAPSTE